MAVPWGSPPRVRGTGTALSAISYIVRITPACAGNSSLIFCESLIDEDHPRVCGEQRFGIF